jgi:hypothetical protein
MLVINYQTVLPDEMNVKNKDKKLNISRSGSWLVSHVQFAHERLTSSQTWNYSVFVLYSLHLFYLSGLMISAETGS